MAPDHSDGPASRHGLISALWQQTDNKTLAEKLEQASLPLSQADDTQRIYAALEAEDRRMAQTFRYVQRTTGFPPCVNTQADYFSLGDELFPAMLEEMKKAERFIFAEYFIVENGLMWDSMERHWAPAHRPGCGKLHQNIC